MFWSHKTHLYMMTLTMGTLMAASSSSWFNCWLGLEINLFSLIPILINKITPSSTETSMKYFIAQALASVFIIFSSSLSLMMNSINFLIFDNFFLVAAIGIKIGAAPFHFWLPQVIQTSEWFQIMIILTWQKIAPMCLMMFSSTNLHYLLIYSSCLVGVMGAMNQMSIKKIMVYSSILHSAWLITISLHSENIWWFYFFIYSLISISVMIPLIFIPMNSIKQLYSSMSNSFFSLIFMINFFSLAGIPPFLGFFMKLITLICLVNLNLNFFTLGFLILSSLMSLYFYTRFIFSSSIMSISKMKPNFYLPFISSNYLFIILSLLGNLFFPIIMFF